MGGGSWGGGRKKISNSGSGGRYYSGGGGRSESFSATRVRKHGSGGIWSLKGSEEEHT